MCMTLSLLCLSFKEPIIAIRLAEDDVSISMIGFFISLDTITYTLCSFGLNFLPERNDGKFYSKLMYFGCIIYVFAMALQGPAPFL